MMKIAPPAFPWIVLWCLLVFTPGSQGQSAAAWMQQGDEWDAKQQAVPALAAYQEAEKLGVPSSSLLQRMARQYGLSMNGEATEAGKKAAGEKALGYARRSVAADPQNADAHVALAICYGRLVRFQETKGQIGYSRLIKAAAEEGLRLNPEHELGCYVLGAWHYGMAGLNPLKRGLARVIYGTLPSASYGEAAAYFRRAIALNPARMASYIDLGLTLLALGDEAGGRGMLAKGLALPDREPDDPGVRARGKKAFAEG